MATATFIRGGTIAVTTSVSVITLEDYDGVYTVFNAEGARVFLTVNSTTTATTTAQATDKFFLDPGVGMRLPYGTTSFAIQTAAGSASVLASRTWA